MNQENHIIKQNVSPKVTPLVFHVRCGTLHSNQYKECECVMEFLLILLNFLQGFRDINQVTEETLNMSHVFNNRALQIFQRKYHIINARRRQMGTLK